MTVFQPFDPYVLLSSRLVTFAPLPYPSLKKPPLPHYQLEAGARLGAVKNETRGLSSPSIANLLSLYKKNTFNTPIPAFEALFSEYATAPFFVFQVSCAALPCPDEYWYYSLFTLFILVMIKCTAVWLECVRSRSSIRCRLGRVRCNHDGERVKVQTDELLPGDVVSLGECLYSLKGVLY